VSASEKRLAANKQNAKKSTGPQTEQGKAISRLNALKHGILSKELLLTGEVSRELEELSRCLRVELRPEGELELVLVDRIATCVWRLRRVLRVETSEIRRSQLRLMEEEDEADLSMDGCARSLKDAKEELQAAEDALAFLKGDGDLLQIDLEDDTPLGKAFDSLADEHFQEVEQNTPATEIRSHALSQGWTAERLRKALVPILQEQVRTARAAVRKAQIRWTVHEKRETERRCLKLVTREVPQESTLNRLLRYEAALERQLYRALHELLRLQSTRAGRPVPPPLALDVDVGVVREGG